MYTILLNPTVLSHAIVCCFIDISWVEQIQNAFAVQKYLYSAPCEQNCGHTCEYFSMQIHCSAIAEQGVNVDSWLAHAIDNNAKICK